MIFKKIIFSRGEKLMLKVLNLSEKKPDAKPVKELEKNEIILKQAEKCYQDALNYINKFRAEPKEGTLLLAAADKLEEAIKLNKSKGEYYFWMAFILYHFNQVKGSKDYLKKAESLVPSYPQIKQLKEIILKNQA
jgi:hypothetical protein